MRHAIWPTKFALLWHQDRFIAVKKIDDVWNHINGGVFWCDHNKLIKSYDKYGMFSVLTDINPKLGLFIFINIAYLAGQAPVNFMEVHI